MSELRLPLALALTLVMGVGLPGATRSGDAPGPAGPSPSAAPAATTEPPADPRLQELEALVPEYFAGLPLRENMQAATGELLATRMDREERAVFEAMLEANGKSIADYAAASVPVRVADADVIVIQPHRVSGIDAASTLDTWIEILELNTERPVIDTVLIGGQDVVLVSDEARPDFPLLHIFAVGDVIWMVAARETAVAEEAVRMLSGASVPDDSGG